MGFTEAVETCLKRKYATFSGRAARSEYWWFILFNYIVMIVVGGIAALIVSATLSETGAPSAIGFIFIGIAVLVILGLFLPSIAVTVRRLHDRNLSGWVYFGLIVIGIVPVIGNIVSIVGSIVLLVMFCMRGTEGDNKFGPDPLNPAGSADIFS